MPKNNKFTLWSSISFLVKVPLVTLGRVDIMAKMMETTLNKIITRVGKTRCSLDVLSSLGINVDNAIEIIMAFTESKILALLSAISLNRIWLFSATRNMVSMPRSGRSIFKSFFFLTTFSILSRFRFLICFSISNKFFSLKTCQFCLVKFVK